MGDKNRHIRFAEFIIGKFPPKQYKSVLVVADGKGDLAIELAKHYTTRVIENNPRNKFFVGASFKYEKGWFDFTTPVPEDFIVGMHPDEATGQIVRNRDNKPYAIVPCCLKGIDAMGISNFTNWIKKLKSLSRREVFEDMIRIGGKNRVLYTR